MPDPTRTSYHGWRRWLLIGGSLLIVLILATVVVLHVVLDAAFIEQRATKALAASTDSLYRVHIDDRDLSLWQGSVQVNGITVVPDSARLAYLQASGHLPALRYEGHATAIRVTGLSLWSLLRGSALRLDRLDIRAPHVQITSTAAPDTAAAQPDSTSSTPSLHAALADALPPFAINQMVVEGGTVSFTGREQGRPFSHTVHNLTLRLDQVTVDSAAVMDSSRVLFSERARVSLDSYRYVSPDSMYVLEVGAVQATSADSTLRVASLELTPTPSDAAFLDRSRDLGDRFKGHAGTLLLHGLQFRSLLDQQGFVAKGAVIDSLLIDILHDAQEKPPSYTPDPYPHEAFQQISVPIRLDTLRIRQADIRYGERAPDGTTPGVITFNNLWASLYNLTNDPAHMTADTPAHIDARADVAGAGRLEVKIDYQLLSPTLDMAFRGTQDAMELRALNQMFVNREGVKITSGHLDQIEFDVKVRHDAATGILEARYQNLAIKVLDKVSKHQRFGDRLKSLIANNFVLKKNNPPEPGEQPAVAVIHHARGPKDPFFKFLWETVRTGLFDTLGVGG